MLKRAWIAAALLICASPVTAQQYENARRLGGPTAFYKPALTNAASLKRMAERQAGDIRTVFQDAGIPEVADAFLTAMSAGTSTVTRGNCGDVAPGDGLVECRELVGATFDWMAYRPRVKGKRVPGRISRVRWAGKASFLAFLVRVTVRDTLYTFIVPKPCGNISLVSAGVSPAAVAAREQAARDQAARDQAAREQAARDQAARDQAARDAAAREQAARDQAARDQAARDQAARDQAARDQTARNEAAAAPAPGTGAQGGGGSSSSRFEEHPGPWFGDVLLGDEHRNRPADLVENKPRAFTQGSGLFAFRVGGEKRFDSKWGIGGAIGYGLMFLFTENTINQNPLFVDVEVNKHFANRMFIGGLLSAWDITRGETWTPAGGGHFGIPLGHHDKHPVYFVGEGRWFFNHRTHLDTHYLAWGGVRVHF